MAPFGFVCLSLCSIGNLFLLAFGHSTMTDPQSISPGTCRLGGEPQFGVLNCPGPCDLRAIDGKFSNHGSEDSPARVFRRGKTATIKYQRNNHGPGGFIRITLVRPEEIMEKAVHQHNAFHYSCWGANPVQASSDELEKDRYGFTFVGSDGEQHGAPKGYYTVDVTIPTCIPDGNYVMGWVWFGGTGGTKIERNEPQEPKPWGYFGDYWACSFVRVEGGDPLSASYQPVFQNDMSQYSEDGCMSANNMPGTCASEPCRVDGVYQKPRPFTEGRIPAPLTPDNFGGIKENSLTSPLDASPSNIPARTTPKTMYPSASPSTPVPIPSYTTVLPPNPSSSPIPSISSTPSAVPSMEEALITPLSLTASLPSETLIDPVYTPEMIILQSPAPEMTTGISTETAPLVTSATVTVPISKTDSELRDKASNSAKLRACLCYMVGTRCSRRLASATEDLCSARTSKSEQLDSCAQGCCDYCQQHMKKRMCMSSSVKRMCAERRET